MSKGAILCTKDIAMRNVLIKISQFGFSGCNPKPESNWFENMKGIFWLAQVKTLSSDLIILLRFPCSKMVAPTPNYIVGPTLSEFCSSL